MTSRTYLSIIRIVGIVALSLHITSAAAQWHPTRAVRLIVPFPPGNIADVQAVWWPNDCRRNSDSRWW
jgi:tripartite-type tricarboxylate transporter receptor subunit TctC